jgi:hypothetical protein
MMEKIGKRLRVRGIFKILFLMKIVKSKEMNAVNWPVGRMLKIQ